MNDWNKPALLQLREIELGESFETIAIRMTSAGKSDEQIADHFRVSRQTYRNWRGSAGLERRRELVSAGSR